RRRGEDAARRGRVEHAGTDGHDVRRLVTAARALHDRHLIVGRAVGTVDDVVFGLVAQQLGVRERDAFEHLRYEIRGIVDELFHDLAPRVVLVLSLARLGLARLVDRLDADFLAEVVQHGRDRDDAGIGAADAALTREGLPAALRNPVARALDRVRRDGGG